MMEKEYCVYILTNQSNNVLYTGVTNNLKRRVLEHKENRGSEFTKKYKVHKLVYFEVMNDINAAILREKQIKAGSRHLSKGLTQNGAIFMRIYELGVPVHLEIVCCCLRARSPLLVHPGMREDATGFRSVESEIAHRFRCTKGVAADGSQ
jgi:putative endonuclease